MYLKNSDHILSRSSHYPLVNAVNTCSAMRNEFSHTYTAFEESTAKYTLYTTGLIKPITDRVYCTHEFLS